MKNSITLFLLAFIQAVSAQQFAFEMWHDGRIVLDTGDTLKGTVKYNMQPDLLQFQLNDHNQSFSAASALFFEIFDSTIKQYRQFYSLPFAATGGYKTPVFFELLSEGKITLLSREALEYRTYSSSFYYGTNTRVVLVYKYFLLQENGSIAEFIGKKNDWLAMMDKRADDVQHYAKEHRLAFDDKQDLVKIVNYYNSFFK